MSTGAWRPVGPGEIFDPGRHFRVNVSSGQTEVRETDEDEISSLLDMARALAAAGLPVFPCNAEKRPAISKAKGGNGFHDASTDPDRIRELWNLAGPAAQLIGVPTGGASGFNVLDLDPRHGSDNWRAANIHRLPETRVHGTPGLPKARTDPMMPGEHWLFRHVDGVRNIQDGKTIAPGIDVRGAGGYVCFPPSGGYKVIHEADIADWPNWLLPIVLKASEPAPRPEPSSFATPSKVSDKRLRGFVDREVRRVRDAPVGARHGARLAAARSIGGVADEAGLSDTEVEEMLIAARPPEVEEEKERRTIRDGLAYGRAAPIDLNTLPDSLFRGYRQARGNGRAPPFGIPRRGAKPPAEEAASETAEMDSGDSGGTHRPNGEAAGAREQPEPAEQEQPDGEANPPKPLTKAARTRLLEQLADLAEDDYDLGREAAAAKMGGLRLSSVDKMVEKIRQARSDADAARAADDAAAAAAARRSQPPPPPPDDTPEVTALIAEFNAKYFVINENGKATIYAPKHDPDQNRKYYERIEFSDLDKLYLNRTVLTGFAEKTGEPIYKPVANVWLRHRDREQYIGGIVFDPSTREHPAEVLNLWQGFAVKPKPGSWALLKEHVHANVCNGNKTHFAYLLDWMADLIQHPEKQGEVAVVLRGIEGTGKGILARALKYLLGQHGFAISNAKHLTGNFNAHLRDCVFLFADEALYAGDKQHVGILKSIITEPYLTIEGKFQNAAMSVNRLHLMLASNELWVVPAGLESRRFYVLDVSGDHANDHAYFAAITKELAHGGYAAMLHELLDRDLSRSNLRSVPVTAALVDQRTRSLDTTTRWWLDCLSRGYVFRSRIGLEDQLHLWLDPISTELLFDSYTEYCRLHRERHPLNRVHFGRWLRTVGCTANRPTGPVIVGEHIVDATTTNATQDGFTRHTGRIAEVVEQARAHGYIVGDLDQARSAFTEATKLAVDWDEDGDTP